MGLIVNTSDFTGRYELALNPLISQRLNGYIDEYEKSFIYKILGVELGTLFVNDITGGVPSNPDYLLIFNELFFEASCKTQFHSIGMKKVLLGLIYFHVLIEGRITTSPSNGVVENSVQGQVATAIPEVYRRYNDSVDSIKAIQRYCFDNSSKFVGFNGQKFLYEW